jgi:hypothetical protein
MRIAPGPTPNGGDHSVASFFRADGTPTDDPAEAATGEVTEYAAGVQVARHYLEKPADPAVPAYTDPGYVAQEGDFEDALTHHTWDVWYSDPATGEYRLVQTRDQLLTATGMVMWPEADQRHYLAQMTASPVWAAAPQPLKDEVRAYLIASRPQKPRG